MLGKFFMVGVNMYGCMCVCVCVCVQEGGRKKRERTRPLFQGYLSRYNSPQDIKANPAVNSPEVKASTGMRPAKLTRVKHWDLELLGREGRIQMKLHKYTKE